MYFPDSGLELAQLDPCMPALFSEKGMPRHIDWAVKVEGLDSLGDTERVGVSPPARLVPAPFTGLDYWPCFPPSRWTSEQHDPDQGRARRHDEERHTIISFQVQTSSCHVRFGL